MKVRVIEYHNIPDYMLFGEMLSLTLMPKVVKIKLLHQKATPYSVYTLKGRYVNENLYW